MLTDSYLKLISLKHLLYNNIWNSAGTTIFQQGCMNNISFGDKSVGYYETVAGGSGAVSVVLYKCQLYTICKI